MTKYFDRITTILKTAPNTQPEVLFVKLLNSYQTDARSVLSNRHHQIFIDRLLQLIARNHYHKNPFELWKIVANFLNGNLPLHCLDIKGDFVQLLNTFLEYYSPLRSLLAADIRKYLDSSPYQFSLNKEIYSLRRQLYTQPDEAGITTATFVNFMLLSSKETQSTIINELLAQWLNEESLSLQIRLQIGVALAKLNSILTAPQITNLISVLFSYMHPPIGPMYRLEISTILSAFAPHLTQHAQYLLLEVSRGNIPYQRYHIQILKNLAPAIPHLSQEVTGYLVKDLLDWARDSETIYSSIALELLYAISFKNPALIYTVIKETYQDNGLYQARDFTILRSLMQPFPDGLRISAIIKLLHILRQGSFRVVWELHSIEDRNIQACFELIIKLYELLANPSRLLIDQAIIEMATTNEATYHFFRLLILLFKGRKIDGLYDLAICLTPSNDSNARYALNKILELMLDNKQYEQLANYLSATFSNPYSICQRPIWFICQLFSKLSPELKILFVQGIKDLFVTLSDEDKFSLLESLGNHNNTELRTALQNSKMFANFYHSRMLPKLNSKTLSILKPEISEAQQAVIVQQLLLKITPVRDDAEREAHDKNCDLYTSICLLAEHLNFNQRIITLASFSVLAIISSVIFSNYARTAFSAIVHCINVSPLDSQKTLIITIIPLLIVTKKHFLKTLLRGLSADMQKFLIERLATPTDNNDPKKINYSLLTAALEILPEDSEIYCFAVNKILDHYHSLKSAKINKYLFSTAAKTMPRDKRVIDILYLLAEKPLTESSIAEFVLASDEKKLTEKYIYTNIRNLYYPNLYSQSCLNLITLSPKMNAVALRDLAQMVSELFEEHYLLSKIGTHAHAFSQTLFIGHPEMFLKHLLNLIPEAKLALFKDLIERFQFDDSDNSSIITHALKGLYPTFRLDFNDYTASCTLDWLLTAEDAEKFLRIRKVVHHGLHNDSVVETVAKNMQPQARETVITRITEQINSGTKTMKAFAENLLFGIFSVADLPLKYLIITKVTALTLKNDFRLTPTLEHALHTMTTKIYTMKEAKAIRFLIHDAYTTKLKKLEYGQYDDGRKALLHMLSNLYYEASVRPWLQKKLQIPELTDYVMRFLI